MPYKTVLLLMPTKPGSDPCTTGIGIPGHVTEPHPTSLIHTLTPIQNCHTGVALAILQVSNDWFRCYQIHMGFVGIGTLQVQWGHI